MLPRVPDDQFATTDDDVDIPSSGPKSKYGAGVALPLLLIGYGIACFVTRHGVLIGEYNDLDLHGSKAVALGTASLSLGVFLHCHFFWGNVFHLSAFAVFGKIIAAVAFIASLGFLIVRVGVFGK